MRIACALIEHPAVQVETRDNPGLGGLPLVVGGDPWERKPVVDCSAEAAAYGIKPGMSLYEAAKLCPEARFLTARPAAYEQAFDRVLAVLDEFSPTVELESLGVAYLEVAGADHLFGPPSALARRIVEEINLRTGLSPRIGIAGGKFAAWVAALTARAGEAVILEEGQEAGFLAPLPVGFLPVSPELRRRLSLLGLVTLGEVASLPRGAMEAQFGREGYLAHTLARGVDPRRVAPRARPGVLTAEAGEESPLDSLEGIMGLVERLLTRLVRELSLRRQACARLGLRLCLENDDSWERTWPVKPPTMSQARLSSLARHRVERLHLPAAVVGVRLTLSDLEAEKGQPTYLWGRQGRADRGEVRALAREVRTRFGIGSLKRVVVVDPDSRLPERRASLQDVEA